MSVTAKPLFTAKYAANAATTEYTAPVGTRTLIDKFIGYNGSAGALTLTVNLVASGGAAGVSNTVIVKTIPAGETYTFPEVVGNYLEPGGFISVTASAATSIVIRASGRESS